MLVIYALLLLRLLGKETRRFITDQRINSVVPVEENVNHGAFFFRDFSQGGEASGGSFTNGNNRPEVQNASTVINLDTLQGAVPSEETPQLHSAPQ